MANGAGLHIRAAPTLPDAFAGYMAAGSAHLARRSRVTAQHMRFF
jgi:hypothetical protein